MGRLENDPALLAGGRKRTEASNLPARKNLLWICLVSAFLLPGIPVFSQDGIYNPILKWLTLKPAPEQKHAFASCVIGTKIYQVGGYTGGFETGRIIIQVYDTETDSWDTVPVPRQFARGFPSAFGIEGKVYILGGAKGQPPTDSDNHTYFSLDVWDPETNTWQVRANFPGDNLGPSWLLNKSIYVVGGFNHDPGPVAKAYRYDITRDVWERLADMNEARALPGLAAHKGRIYAFGGFTERTFDPGGYDYGDRTCEIYDPETNTWTAGPELPGGRYFLGKEGIIAINDDVLCFGACRGPWASHNPDPWICRLNGKTSQWELYDSFPYNGGAFFNAERVGEKLYLMGGYPNNLSCDLSPLLSEQEQADAFMLYPNPTDSNARIKFSTSRTLGVSVTVCSSMGKTIRQILNTSLPAGDHEIPVELSGLGPGIYFVVVRADRVYSQLLIRE